METMREAGTFFSDVSALGKIRLSGKGAPEFVEVMTSVAMWRIAIPGHAALALVLNAEAEIIDLVMLARTGEREFLLVSNPATTGELTEWLKAHAELTDAEGHAAFDEVKVEDKTAAMGAVALYGPMAHMILSELCHTNVSAALEEKNLAILTVGTLQVLVVRWPLLHEHNQVMPLSPEDGVIEVFLPAKAVDALSEILLGFEEIDPESFEAYKAKRREAHTWFDAAEQAAYTKPNTADLKALLRTSRDFVGARALE